ncbi:MAG: M23 family metallopeptidase [Hyphomicrobiaceae bacterium]|nr:M23 family metallopeptidase [Hyphomicrobiaceae bacterium]
MSRHRPPALAIDLGHEPPLLADGGDVLDRRKLSLRWLSGTILTGMTSVFLMGGALIVALEGRYSFAAPTRDGFEVSGGPGAAGADAGQVRKGDRLRPASEPASSRQVLHLPTVTRDGDRDLVRVQPFIRIEANLRARRTAAMDRIPAFNPAQVMGSDDAMEPKAGAATPQFYAAKVEGEFTLKSRDMPADSSLYDPDITMSSDEVEKLVREQAALFTAGKTQVAAPAAPVIDPNRFALGFAADAGMSNPAITTALENVSSFSKSGESAAPQAKPGASRDEIVDPGNSGLEEKLITVSARDTFKNLLRDQNATDKEAADIIAAFRKSHNFKGLDPQSRLRVGLARIDDSADKPKPVRISIYSEKGQHLGTVALADDGSYVAAIEPDAAEMSLAAAEEPVQEADSRIEGAPSLYESIYATALENQIPRKLISNLIQIYSFDLDFNSSARPGDSFQAFYGLEDENDPNSAKDILYTSVNVRGQQKRYFRFRAPDDGSVDYYDEQGKSAKKFLIRKPMDGGETRSGFGYRRHPIYRYVRMHTGIDWAAPTGTPIYASGNGMIEKLGWHAGYGRYIRIQHANGYESAYAHMSGWARGLGEGDRVRQGQLIGYVGSTGASTGPHLHYEVLINEVHVDPMRVRLPRGRELSGKILAEFQQERARIEELVVRPTGGRLAQAN